MCRKKQNQILNIYIYMRLGDIIEKITIITGIKRFTNWVTGNSCGCDNRKEKLNRLWDRVRGKKN